MRYTVQTINMDTAKSLDPEASSQVAAAFASFNDYVSKKQSTNIRIALAVSFQDTARLGELLKQIDLDSAVGKAAIIQMDAACGR